ncbi:metallophosphoesterase [Dyadobacter chenwenxiniae]|uniref:Metallophosphoesterase n=1 Tax=Dyadobacter chenwenxiniae TaxID=2906456 RepID=A0A9X1PQG8_9BACT|nr:metallophosphoesterase [Dyadobacter chenwenxiniae]MCF0063813.1 metallophosphoesterase [Dyadobacter chenwenxiniae]UON83489.1 metallophosphoesterase [Dyadobacter chenwenxiniae]
MNRRNWIKNAGLVTGAATAAPVSQLAESSKKKPVLTVAHITDVHIRAGDDAPARFKRCLEDVKKHHVDFFLNGGDSIHAADYKDVTREQMLEYWKLWDECTVSLKGFEVHSCIGNHDPWWAAPSEQDEMYGKDYVVKRLGTPGRYYSITKKGWHFIMLDGNNANISLDEEQFTWLKDDLEKLPANTPVVVMSHYPILGATPMLVGGGHSDFKKLKALFYKHKDKVKICLSGHQHLQDSTFYNGVQYCCNGAVSGFWWGKGDAESAAPNYYQETPPGFAILRLFEDGTVTNTYYPHAY